MIWKIGICSWPLQCDSPLAGRFARETESEPQNPGGKPTGQIGADFRGSSQRWVWAGSRYDDRRRGYPPPGPRHIQVGMVVKSHDWGGHGFISRWRFLSMNLSTSGFSSVRDSSAGKSEPTNHMAKRGNTANPRSASNNPEESNATFVSIDKFV